MNKFPALLFLVIIFTFQNSLKAQSELLPGFIITKENDTIYGYLLNEVDSKLNNHIEFYSNASDTIPETYTASEINSFFYDNGRTFKSLQRKKDSIPEFAKRVTTGKINMYVGHEKVFGKLNVYLNRSDTNLSVKLLPPQKKTFSEGGKTYNRKDKNYIGLLSYITGNTQVNRELNSTGYTEKEIKKYISSYNSEFEESFPSSVYVNNKKTTYMLTAGLPFNIKSEITHFRISAYRDVTYIEKSSNISFRMGMSYRYWKSNEEVNTNYQNAATTYRQQFLSIIPIGVNFHGNPKKIIPYGYIGLGLGILFNSNYEIRQYEITGKENEVFYFAAFNIGSGIKIAVNSGYLIVEITPSYSGIFFNFGYAF